MSGESVVANNNAYHNNWSLPEYYQSVPVSPFQIESNFNPIGPTNYISKVEDAKALWSPNQTIGSLNNLQELDLNSLLSTSGNLTKDTMLLFSLLKTVTVLKKSWAGMPKAEREGVLKVFRIASSEAAAAWKDDIYYEAIIPDDFTQLDDSFYEDLGYSDPAIINNEDAGPVDDEPSIADPDNYYSADIKDVIEPTDVVQASDAYNEPSAFVTPEPPWSAFSEAVAVVQGRNGEEDISKIFSQTVQAIDYEIKNNDSKSFPVEIELALTQAVVVGLALRGRAAGATADIADDYVSLPNQIHNLTKWHGNWSGAVQDVEKLVLVTEEVVLANAIKEKIEMFDQWIHAMGSFAPESLITLRDSYVDLKNKLEKEHKAGISSPVISVIGESYADLATGDLMREVKFDLMLAKRAIEEEKESNVLKGLAFVGIMIGSIVLAEFTGGYSLSWMLEAGASLRFATIGSFLISAATMVGVQELGSQALLDAPSKDFLGYLEEYGWLVLALGVIKAPQLARGIFSGKKAFSFSRGIPIVGGKYAPAGTRLLSGMKAGEWLSPAMLKHLGWAYVALTGIEALREVAHGRDPANALSPESMGTRLLFLGSVVVVGRLMQPWRQNLLKRSMDKLWRGYEMELVAQDVEIARATNEIKLLSNVNANHFQSGYRGMYELYMRLLGIAEARLTTLRNIDKSFGKGSVAGELMATAEKNVTLAEAKLAEARVWNDLVGVGNKGGVERAHDGWIYNDGPSTSAALSALIKHYTAKGYNMTLSVGEGEITLWYASKNGQVDFVSFRHERVTRNGDAHIKLAGSSERMTDVDLTLRWNMNPNADNALGYSPFFSQGTEYGFGLTYADTGAYSSIAGNNNFNGHDQLKYGLSGGNMQNGGHDSIGKLEGVEYEAALDPSPRIIREVVGIQQVLAIGNELIRQGVTTATSGLLISGYTEHQMQEFVTGGGTIFVSRHVPSEEYVGYLLASSPNSFHSKYVDARKWWQSKAAQEKYDSVILENDYVYLDQIGVMFDYHGTGVAKGLLEEFETHYKGQTVISLIISEPIDNVRSKGFFLKNGYEVICEILFSKYGTVKNFRGILIAKEL